MINESNIGRFRNVYQFGMILKSCDLPFQN